jgi:hypothetical protein
MKPVITKIEIDNETKEELNALLNSSRYKNTKNTEIRRLVGGVCTVCGKIPSTRVSYQVGDEEQQIERLEFYCDDHITRLRATNGIDEAEAIRDDKFLSGIEHK